MAMSLAAKDNQRDPLLDKANLYIGTRKQILGQDIMEVMRTASAKPLKSGGFAEPGPPEAAHRLRDVLRLDPNNLRAICELGFVYASEGRWSMASNVLLRGFKRVGELRDARLRVAMLMTLCEASMREGKVSQAHAAFRDIEEPDDADQLTSYQIMAIQVYAGNGDVQRALKMLSAAIEGEDWELTVRIWAIVVADLEQAGAFEAGKTLIEKVAGIEDVRADGMVAGATLEELERAREAYQRRATLELLENYAERLRTARQDGQRRPGDRNPKIRAVIAVGMFMGVAIALAALYWLEQKSLKRFAWSF